MDENEILESLKFYNTHSEILEALKLISKSKLKKGKERFVMLEKAKNALYPFSGDKTILLAISAINKLT